MKAVDGTSTAGPAAKKAGGGASAGAAGGGEGGLVPGAGLRLSLLCVYLVCTCVSQGFLMVVLPLFLVAAFGWGAPIYASIISKFAFTAKPSCFGP